MYNFVCVLVILALIKGTVWLDIFGCFPLKAVMIMYREQVLFSKCPWGA